MKEAWTGEILEITDDEEHGIGRHSAQHPHLIDSGRVNREYTLNVKHHFEMLFLK